MSWFPHQYDQEFLFLGALVALISTVLLIWHMNTVWQTEVTSTGRRWRYRTLLFASILLTLSFGDIAIDDVQVTWRHVAWVVLTFHILYASVISLREDFHFKREHQGL